ncbi:MAG: hypothetical protein ABSA02_38965 [Trebonia sp.]|jgi:hypothetical protein
MSEGGQSALPIPAAGPNPRLDRVAAATFDQLSAALIFLSAFHPDAFDYAMDAIESGNDEPGATGEAEPVCAICDAKIGIFLDRGLAWQHYTGDGTTVGQQHIYDPGHAPLVTWRFSEELQSHD